MVIQMPVFIALYLTLSNAIELRDAPFVGWIHDLSAGDPYFILPIAMGATMLFQQWYSAVDKAQFRSMAWLPLVFMFTFLWLPSGVVLYWFVSNLLAILQQAMMKKQTT